MTSATQPSVWNTRKSFSGDQIQFMKFNLTENTGSVSLTSSKPLTAKNGFQKSQTRTANYRWRSAWTELIAFGKATSHFVSCKSYSKKRFLANGIVRDPIRDVYFLVL